MRKIILNSKGVFIYPHLKDEVLEVYGLSEKFDSFLVWDFIELEWIWVQCLDCEGVRGE